MDHLADKFSGCILGSALGDALGAPREGGVLERVLWKSVGRTRQGQMRWTDDTQMSIDVIESLVAEGAVDPDDLARRFATSYRWHRGYGPGTAKLLKRVRRGRDWRRENTAIYPEGSFGNGAAMRAPPIGLFYFARLDELEDAVRQSAIVTHSHPLAIEGASIIAFATAAATLGRSSDQIVAAASDRCCSDPFRSKLVVATRWLESERRVVPKATRRELGNGITAANSVVTALYMALWFRDESFVDMQRAIGSIGGDTDTIGAMAGAIWGAANGHESLPIDAVRKLEQHERLASLARGLYENAAKAL